MWKSHESIRNIGCRRYLQARSAAKKLSLWWWEHRCLGRPFPTHSNEKGSRRSSRSVVIGRRRFFHRSDTAPRTGNEVPPRQLGRLPHTFHRTTLTSPPYGLGRFSLSAIAVTSPSKLLSAWRLISTC